MKMPKDQEIHLIRDFQTSEIYKLLETTATGKILLKNSYEVKALIEKINKNPKNTVMELKYSELNAIALIESIKHYILKNFLSNKANNLLKNALSELNQKFGKEEIDKVFILYVENFVLKIEKHSQIKDLLNKTIDSYNIRELLLEELILLKLCNNNLALKKYIVLFNDDNLAKNSIYSPLFYFLLNYFEEKVAPTEFNIIKLLMEPSQIYPGSLNQQMNYIKQQWSVGTDNFSASMNYSLDLIKEENKINFGGSGPSRVLEFTNNEWNVDDSPNFSPDSGWMPGVILLAKNALVWLDQLSKKYRIEIRTLDQIPNNELDSIANKGINCLWLIGIWNRSTASKKIKNLCGNKDSDSSAYSLFSYDISEMLGGWNALNDLKVRCLHRGIRLASDMIPNHTGIDSKWILEKPQWFIQTDQPPFPSYRYSGENLSHDPHIGIYLEDHYYNKSDAAVTFKRVDFKNGKTNYIYHGNDGTAMPWNDTAQLDFLQHEVREAVIQKILDVAKVFPIIRFDAAMTLAKKHIQRLWYPEPGKGGAIASRSDHSLSNEDFEKAIGDEFWKDVVQRVTKESPGTLLLAEAFWMMEGYFVRNLGMHRVYNSAFMNMTKNEENDKYRETIKNTISYDRKILKRFVNFMSNPDEETAVSQFGKGDKYFGVFTLLITLPGLPMIGHGQLEGYLEKYGMEFSKAKKEEINDKEFLQRHDREIFPILRKRQLFATAKRFRLYDLIDNDVINENVYAYTNFCTNDLVLVLFNNSPVKSQGIIKVSAPYRDGKGTSSYEKTETIGQSLNLRDEDDYFCIFKDQKSQLWYIRNNKDVINKGLFIYLKPYESHVFTDIHELCNSSKNHIKEIANKLKGKGSKDLDREYREILFSPLYTQFKSIFGDDLFDFLKNEESHSKLQSFYVRKGSSKAAKDTKPSSPEQAQKDSGSTDIDSQTNDISSRMYRNILFVIAEVKNFTNTEGDEKLIAQQITLSFSKLYTIQNSLNKCNKEWGSFYRGLSFENIISFYLLCILENLFPILSSKYENTNGAELLENYMVSNLISDILRDQSFSNDFICKVLNNLKFFMDRDLMQSLNFDLNPTKENFLTLQNEHCFKNLVGLNTFNNTLWFNKEKMESFIWWYLFKGLLQIEKISIESKSIDQLFENELNLRKQAKCSRYDFDEFISLI